MIDRLLARLEPQRRHLTYLVGLLVLTFVLSCALAFGAWRSERQRLDGGTKEIRANAENTAAQWANHLQRTLGDVVQKPMRLFPFAVAADLDVPLESLPATVPGSDICPDCREPFATSFFSIHDDSTHLLGDALSASAVAVVSRHLGSPNARLIADSEDMAVYAGAYFVDDDGRVRLVMAYQIRTAERTRTVGAVLSEENTRTVLAGNFRGMPVLPVQFHNDSVYTLRFAVAGSPLITHAEPVEHVGREVLGRQQNPIVFGGQLEIGVRPARYAAISSNTVPNTATFLPALLLAIMMIMLVMSLLLVRREQELVRLRAEFISSVSHELRTPLAQIRMFTETLMLGRVRSDVERRRSLEIIDQEARRLSSLVENVLLFSRSEGGARPKLTPQTTPVAGEIRSAVEGFGPMLRVHSADIRTELQEDLVVAVDRDALRQIMINLIDNALKYGPSGQRVLVGAALYDTDARVWVDDEGPGIPAPDRERVFESFVRLRRDVDSNVRGSGIGLAVVRELARLHGGNAWAEAAPGGGARIVVQFPDAYLRTETAAGISVAS